MDTDIKRLSKKVKYARLLEALSERFYQQGFLLTRESDRVRYKLWEVRGGVGVGLEIDLFNMYVRLKYAYPRNSDAPSKELMINKMIDRMIGRRRFPPCESSETAQFKLQLKKYLEDCCEIVAKIENSSMTESAKHLIEKFVGGHV